MGSTKRTLYSLQPSCCTILLLLPCVFADKAGLGLGQVNPHYLVLTDNIIQLSTGSHLGESKRTHNGK